MFLPDDGGLVLRFQMLRHLWEALIARGGASAASEQVNLCSEVVKKVCLRFQPGEHGAFLLT